MPDEKVKKVTWTAGEAKTSFRKMLDLVEEGTTVEIIRHGKHAGTMNPPETQEQPERQGKK